MSTSPITEPIRIRVPGTTSNFGPGFDCLGAALQVYNTVEIQPLSEGADAPAHPMVEQTKEEFYSWPETKALSPIRFAWSISGDVPVSRGLGSSVTLRLGILEALNEAHGNPLTREQLFQACTKLEGHPDNAGPAVFGGFFVGGPNGSYFTFPLKEELKFILLVRALEVKTEACRKLLPNNIPRVAAVENVGNAASITAAFASGNYEALRGLFRDHLHQPYREVVNPGLFEILSAGEAAGALGGFLSGSGSCVACLTTGDQAETIGLAMQKACPDDKEAQIRIVAADNRGSHRVST